jgi:hypothetical protein
LDEVKAFIFFSGNFYPKNAKAGDFKITRSAI